MGYERVRKLRVYWKQCGRREDETDCLKLEKKFVVGFTSQGISKTLERSGRSLSSLNENLKCVTDTYEQLTDLVERVSLKYNRECGVNQRYARDQTVEGSKVLGISILVPEQT